MIDMFSLTPYSYPTSKSVKEILISSIAAGTLVYLFIIIFQPFGTENFNHPYKYLILFPYTIIFGVAFFISDLCVFRFKSWNIGSELLKILMILFLGSVLSYFYNSLFISHVALSFENYGYMFLYSLAVGIPISAIYILSRYIYLKSYHENSITAIDPQLTQNPVSPTKDNLNILINNTKFTITEDNLLCIQALENYCTLYYLDNNRINKQLFRISLSNLLIQIEKHNIQRCHRSYIVNLDKVKNMKGNAQGYKLILPEMDFDIPVSRSFISVIIPRLQQFKR
jgi:putative flippase GtrA